MPLRSRGFTLVELVIVIGMLIVSTAIAMPFYQTFTIRDKVAKGIDGTAPTRAAVAETWRTGR